MSNLYVPDASVLIRLREIVCDASPDVQRFTDQRCFEALRNQRKIVRFRDPMVKAVGVLWRAPYTHSIPLPRSDVEDSKLYWEPGGVYAQSPQHLRAWDPTVAPEVWLNGVKLDPTDYKVDYFNGRLQVVAGGASSLILPIEDWKPIQASFVYFRLLHAARELIASASAGKEIKIMLAGDRWDYPSPAEALAALDSAIAEISPKIISWDRKIY